MNREVVVPDGVVAVADHAPSIEERAPVLLLHGFTGDKTSFDGQDGLVAVLGRTRRVLVPDLPGHGTTAIAGAPCTLARTADLLRSMLETQGVARATVVGYSMGGRLALQLALRSAAVVERLALVSASAGLPSEDERSARRQQDEELARFIEDHSIEEFVARWEALPLFATERVLSSEVRAARRRQRLRSRPSGLAASLRAMGTGAQAWLGPRLGELSMPVLVVAGMLDQKFAAIARGLAPGVRGGALALVDGAGHAVHLEQPASVAALLREFLDGKEEPCRSNG